MEDLITRGRHKIAGNTVSLASNGGEVDAAMELGRALRKLGVSTVVAEGEKKSPVQLPVAVCGRPL